jgi:hypothetical protein
MEKKILVLLIILLLIVLAVNSFFIFSEKSESKSNSSSILTQLINEFKFNSSAFNKSITSKEKESSSSSSTQSSTSQNNNSNSSSTQPVIEACLAKYNLTRSTIVFYYFDEPHSNNMRTIVNQLTNYTFYIKSTLTDSQFNLCLGYSSFTVPTFICSGTKQTLVGETSKATLEGFAAACK